MSTLYWIVRRITEGNFRLSGWGKPLLGMPEIEITWKSVRQSRVVIDKAFEMDARYAAIIQQHPKRWLPDACLIFRDPGSRKHFLCP